MKYYCKDCETEILLSDDVSLSVGVTITTPDKYFDGMCPNYETPAQYEERTGKAFPSGGLVWYRIKCAGRWQSWQARCWHKSIKDSDYEQYFIADPPVPPPNDWEPEEITE